MDGTRRSADDQAARWNRPGGNAWVEMQAVLDEMFRPFEDLLVDAVSAGHGSRVLDVGCGTGGITLAVARRLAPAGRCLGVDISEPVIAAARARAEQEGTPASFVRADAQDHAFEPASFDFVISRFGVMFFNDSVRAFENLRHASTDEGRLRFVAWRAPAENPFMTTAERAAAPLLPDLPARRPDGPGSSPSRIRRKSAASWRTAAGPRPTSSRSTCPVPCPRRNWPTTSPGSVRSVWPCARWTSGPASRSSKQFGPRSTPLCRARRSASPRPAGWSAPGRRPHRPPPDRPARRREPRNFRRSGRPFPIARDGRIVMAPSYG